MKLVTTIKPRREGVVHVVGVDGNQYTFEPDALGELTCVVEDRAVILQLFKLGQDFMPASEEDFELARKMMDQADDFVDDGEQSGGQEDLDDDDLVDPNAPPAEGLSASEKPPEPGTEIQAIDMGALAQKSDSKPAADQAAGAATVLLGSDSFPSVITMLSRDVPLGEVVAAAHAESGLSVEDWNKQSEAGRATAIANVLNNWMAADAQAVKQIPDKIPEVTQAAPAAAGKKKR